MRGDLRSRVNLIIHLPFFKIYRRQFVRPYETKVGEETMYEKGTQNQALANF